MISQDQLRDVVGAAAYDRDGDKIGQLYYDDVVHGAHRFLQPMRASCQCRTPSSTMTGSPWPTTRPR